MIGATYHFWITETSIFMWTCRGMGGGRGGVLETDSPQTVIPKFSSPPEEKICSKSLDPKEEIMCILRKVFDVPLCLGQHGCLLVCTLIPTSYNTTYVD